jgi:phage anti-repressor protein
VSYSAQQCLDRARECDWMASQAKDHDAKAAFIECARQWQELARQKEELARDRPMLP